MTHFYSIFIAACFVLMFIFWILTAFSTKRTVEKKGGTVIRIIFYLIIILVIYLQGHVAFLATNLWPKTVGIKIIADLVTFCGLLVMIWARITLGRNWSANIVLKEDHKLVTNGPYAYVRHPIYSGLILMILGVVLYVDTLILTIFFVAFFFGAYYKARKEEKLLMTTFEREYSEYKKKVKALVPLVF